MVLPGPARLSVDSLIWLLRAERIGEPHPVLVRGSVWHPPRDQDGRHRRASAEIAGLGWYDDRGRLEVEVAAALAILCRAEVEFYGWVARDGVVAGVLAAGLGRHGLLAEREGESVRLSPITGRGLADTLAARTPDIEAGQGKPVTVSGMEVAGRRITEAVRSGPAVRRIRELAALPLLGKGELYVSVRKGPGHYRVSKPLRYADTARGRYLNVAVGSDHVLVAPAARADLVTRLRELRRALTR